MSYSFILNVPDITCDACITSIIDVLQKVPAVIEDSDLDAKTIYIVANNASDESNIIAQIESIGFKVSK